MAAARHDAGDELGPARALGRVLGRLERGDLDADDVAVARDVGQQRAQAGVAQAAGRPANCAGRIDGSSTSRSRWT